MTATLSISVPLELTVRSDGRAVVICDQIPMLLVGRDPEAAQAQVDIAMELVGRHLMGLGEVEAKNYLRRRGVEYSWANAPTGRDEDQTLQYRGGTLVHA